MATEKTDRKPTDKTPQAKLQRALDALRGAATAYFGANDTAFAVFLREKADEIAKGAK